MPCTQLKGQVVRAFHISCCSTIPPEGKDDFRDIGDDPAKDESDVVDADLLFSPESFLDICEASNKRSSTLKLSIDASILRNFVFLERSV